MVSAELATAVAERNAILRAMDGEGAKDFIRRHGGKVPQRPLNWVKVLHLARWEITTLSEEERAESRLWLAQHGAQSVMRLARQSPYLWVVMDLIFPRNLIEEEMRQDG